MKNQLQPKLLAGLTLAMGFVLIAGLAAGATTRYVALSGDGSDGSNWAAAYTNIQSAINASDDGDTILIKAGQYDTTAQLVIGTGTNLTLRGGYEGVGAPGGYSADATATVIRRNASAGSFRILYMENTGGWIEGLTFENGASPLHGGGVYLGTVTTVFTNCVIRSNASNSHYYGGGVYATGGSPLFDTCIIRDNLTVHTNGRGAGIFTLNAALTMRNCEIRGNYCGGTGGAGAFFSGSGPVLLFNCLVVNNRVGGSGNNNLETRSGIYTTAPLAIENSTVAYNYGEGIINAGTAAVSVRNSIVWANLDDIVGNVTVSYSCVENTGTSGDGVIHDDPGFVYGYYLKTNSLCIDAGGDSAAAVGLAGWHAQAFQTDAATVDLGYHKPYGVTLAERFVDASRPDDTGDGSTQGTAYKTLTRALADAETGWTLHVAAGEYNRANGEQFPLVIDSKTVRIIGADPATTLLDAGTATPRRRVMVVWHSGPGGLLSNLTFANGSANLSYGVFGLSGGGALIAESILQVENCVFRNNIAANHALGGGVMVSGGAPVFADCRFHNNITSGAYGCGGGLASSFAATTISRCVFKNNQQGGNGGGGILVWGNPTRALVRIENCIVSDNYYQSSYTERGSGIRATRPVSIENCTVADNASQGIRVGNTHPFTLANSIVWNNGGTNLFFDVAEVPAHVVRYNCIGDAPVEGQNGNVNADPFFVDTTYYHLRSRMGHYTGGYFAGGAWAVGVAGYSPLIAAGDPASDFSLEPLPNGGRINMGAYGNTPVASKFMPCGTLILVH